jgi:hypothetical protein
MWPVLGLFARELSGNRPLQQEEKTELSMGSNPRVYNRSLVVALSSTESRTTGMGMQQSRD